MNEYFMTAEPSFKELISVTFVANCQFVEMVYWEKRERDLEEKKAYYEYIKNQFPNDQPQDITFDQAYYIGDGLSFNTSKD
tara:strand:+ start:343 stop:585 length:243 start_codon:yes stop_codon:yes gene_type:complete